ncbi:MULTISPECIES: Mu transposase C-terminal domain-containing protein [unclassified Yoonia]|uniref:Mu transposase C-terminal domain-containing protein n=1 Tax=unclassified Yoonia TaxID=2629118 RepID=UPI002AFE2932|nr:MULTISPECIES: Mu transposase C-terminal domain-containing protein [unclassified Yoonia]
MSRDFDRRFPSFVLGPHDRITIEGKQMRLSYMSGDQAILVPADGNGLTESFDVAQLNRLSAAGKVLHEVEYYLPPQLRSASVRNFFDLVAPNLPPAHRQRVDIRYAMAQALMELNDRSLGKNRIKMSDESITANMPMIREYAADYLEKDCPNPAAVEKLRKYRDGTGKKPRGGGASLTPEAANARTIRKWVALVKAGGKWALIDKCANRGNHSSYFSPEENALMMKTVNEFYLHLNGHSPGATAQEVRKVFTKENEARLEKGLSALRIPSREAVRKLINSLDKFMVLVARRGQKEAIKLMKPVGQGLTVSRPFERVEIDETKIDLITIMAQSGLLGLFTTEELTELGLDNTKDRWWLVVAIDCRTRMIVGMQLTRNPTTSAALECLRMTMTPKGHFADAVGALTPWNASGKCETLVADNGVFKSIRFTDACADLGVDVLRTIAGSPSMRGTIERLFRTASMKLFSRLSGRTFSNVLQRGDHPSEDRACLYPEDLCFALVRWIVDIYHNTSHEGLGGRTPLQQWEADHEAGNYPLHALPLREHQRLAFGLPLTRQLRKDGITILGLRYHSEELARWFLIYGNQDVDVRWDHQDIGAVSVHLDGRWMEVKTVHEVSRHDQPFDGLSAAEWTATNRALRTGDPKRKEWDENVVFAALDAIKDMNAQKQQAFKIVDRNWNEKTFIDREALFSGFSIQRSAPKTRDSEDGFGRSIEPRAPQSDAVTATDPAITRKSKSAAPSKMKIKE